MAEDRPKKDSLFFNLVKWAFIYVFVIVFIIIFVLLSIGVFFDTFTDRVDIYEYLKPLVFDVYGFLIIILKILLYFIIGIFVFDILDFILKRIILKKNTELFLQNLLYQTSQMPDNRNVTLIANNKADTLNYTISIDFENASRIYNHFVDNLGSNDLDEDE